MIKKLLIFTALCIPSMAIASSCPSGWVRVNIPVVRPNATCNANNDRTLRLVTCLASNPGGQCWALTAEQAAATPAATEIRFSRQDMYFGPCGTAAALHTQCWMVGNAEQFAGCVRRACPPPPVPVTVLGVQQVREPREQAVVSSISTAAATMSLNTVSTQGSSL